MASPTTVTPAITALIRTTLSAAPWPTAPHSVTVPNTSRMGRTFVRFQPASTTSCPEAARSALPMTGASTSATLPGRRAATSSSACGPMVEASIRVVPGRRCPAIPPTTSRTAVGSASMVMTTSASRTASAGLAATLAPSAWNGSARDAVRFQTVSGYPAASRRLAIGLPMIPRPIKAIFSMRSIRVLQSLRACLVQARGEQWQRGVDQAPQGVQRMSHLQVIGLGAIGWPEDDLADRVGEGVLPQAPVQVSGAEQLGVVLCQPREQGWPLDAEAGLRVEGPDDRDEFQVPRAHAGELQVDQCTDAIAVDQDVAQVEVSVQQDRAVGRQVPKFGQALSCRVQHAVVDERKLSRYRDQPEDRRGRPQHQLRAGAAQRIGVFTGVPQQVGKVSGH